jgi:hypothetical protein
MRAAASRSAPPPALRAPTAGWDFSRTTPGPCPSSTPPATGSAPTSGTRRGPTSPSSRGYDWKLLFEIADYANALASDAYQRFSQALGSAGYTGDTKISMKPGWARFQYNTLIVHAHSRADAAIAEQVAASTFGAALVGYARGTDVDTATELPGDILAFIQFQD